VVFPNATYRCHAADWHHFVDGPCPDERTAPQAHAASRPDGDLRRRRNTGTGHRRPPLPTPGSTIFVLSSGQQRALVLGGIAHNPVEFLDGGWEAVYDFDKKVARQIRARLIDEIEQDGTPVASPHFSQISGWSASTFSRAVA